MTITSHDAQHLAVIPSYAATAALTASTTTLTPTTWNTTHEYTIAAGVTGVLKLASPGAVAGYVVTIRVAYTPGSSRAALSVLNSNDAALYSESCAFSRTRTYVFEWTGSTWVSLQQRQEMPTNNFLGVDGSYDFMLSETVIEEDFGKATGTLAGGLTASASGKGAAVTQGDVATMHGVAICSTGTTTTGSAGAINTTKSNVRLGLGEVVVGAVFALPVLSDGTDTYTFQLGLYDSASTTSVAFRYNSSTATYFECRSVVSGASSSIQSSGVTVVAGTIYRAAIVVDAARTAVRFYINGSLVATCTTAAAIPATATQLGIQSLIVKTAGKTSRDLYLDKIKARWTNLSTTIT